MEARAQWTTAVKVLGEDYRTAYGEFTAKEKKVYEEELKIAGKMTRNFDSWSSKAEDSEDEIFYDAVEWL